MKITGFTRMMHIEKGLRHVSVDGCEVIGMGGVGTVYRINDDTIIKVFREGTTLAEVEKEVERSLCHGYANCHLFRCGKRR